MIVLSGNIVNTQLYIFTYVKATSWNWQPLFLVIVLSIWHTFLLETLSLGGPVNLWRSDAGALLVTNDSTAVDETWAPIG